MMLDSQCDIHISGTHVCRRYSVLCVDFPERCEQRMGTLIIWYFIEKDGNGCKFLLSAFQR